jgi:hypothetical protein
MKIKNFLCFLGFGFLVFNKKQREKKGFHRNMHTEAIGYKRR